MRAIYMYHGLDYHSCLRESILFIYVRTYMFILPSREYNDEKLTRELGCLGKQQQRRVRKKKKICNDDSANHILDFHS